MPNHGKCKNCWWWKPIENNWTGICYMQTIGCNYYTDENSYCPDYLNRKKGDKEETLEEWIIRMNSKQ
jgi:hypothetical protein